ncbi:FG-GAP repeat protein [Gilvimarinus agarilyticus]|uniref:FG-GAP repeat protein n=1 Tax=Gilvimarinus sp. 2_MG-2023 TaxID=3062666 RepID=UPI001C09950B|nr:FG-GAP repeat protein [Gilvimarinus sp. 2_MG-2023]MBU2885649.1 FG-GAP repeat protein [Gilvimarinus agarilyticus]MDO6570508.1 hypothetical protein [Gilvimarinus sp. 2_MG-2023]
MTYLITHKVVPWVLASTAVFLTACGGSSPQNGVSNTSPPTTPLVETATSVKTLTLSWDETPNADFYRVYSNIDGSSGFEDISGSVTTTSFDISLSAHLHNWPEATYMVEACNNYGCQGSSAISIQDQMLETIGYLKASDLLENSSFGFSLAMSDDASTIAVGAPNYNRLGDDGKEDRSVGKVYIYRQSDSNWSLAGTIDNPTPNSGINELFGYAIALTQDGSKILISAPGENGGGRTVNAEDRSTKELDTGAAYLYAQNGEEWVEEAYFKASNADREDYFGIRLDMTPDGKKIVISSPYEASAANHNGDPEDNSIPLAGAVYMFENTNEGWAQTHYIKPSTGSHPERFCFDPRPDNNVCYEKSPSRFGYGLAISDSGDVLAVGAPGDSSASEGINSSETDYRAKSSGAVHILNLVDDNWVHTQYIKSINNDIDDEFGLSLALSGNGKVLAIAAPYEDSNYQNLTTRSTIESLVFDPTLETEQDSGAVYLLQNTNEQWEYQAFIKAARPDENDLFGWHMSLNNSGNLLAIGSPRDDSEAVGISDGWDNSSAPAAGAVGVYRNDEAGEWAMINYIKASNTDANDTFGRSVALSSDGHLMAVSATGEDSRATTPQGNQGDDTGENAGAVYIY